MTKRYILFGPFGPTDRERSRFWSADTICFFFHSGKVKFGGAPLSPFCGLGLVTLSPTLQQCVSHLSVCLHFGVGCGYTFFASRR